MAFLVDHLSNTLRMIGLLTDVAAGKNHLLLASKCHRSRPFAHAEFRNHPTDNPGGRLDVVALSQC